MSNLTERRAMIRAYRRHALWQGVMNALTMVFLVGLSAMSVVVTLFLIQVLVEANR